MFLADAKNKKKRISYGREILSPTLYMPVLHYRGSPQNTLIVRMLYLTPGGSRGHPEGIHYMLRIPYCCMQLHQGDPEGILRGIPYS